MAMNIKQKAAICVGSLLLLVSVFFPVWSVSIIGLEVMNSRGFLYSDATRFVCAYANKTGQTRFDLSATPKASIDYRRMAAECSLILLLTVAAVALTHTKQGAPFSPKDELRK